MFPDELLAEVRRRFCHVESDPYRGERVFLESAGGSLTLESVVEEAARWTAMPDNTGRRNPASKQIEAVIERGRRDAAVFLNARDGAILSGESTTAVIFRLVEAAAANADGGNIVCTDLDHPATYDSTRYFAEQYGLEWRVAKLDAATGRVPPEAFEAVVDERTAAACFIHASNVTGGKNDVAAIGRVIRRRAPQALIIVDGAQHAPHGVVDVSALGVDGYAIAAYKAFGKVGTTFA